MPSLISGVDQELSAAPTLALLKATDAPSNAELHWRFGIILSAPIMALLAFPLSYTTPRQGRFGKLAVGILLYAVYANLMCSITSLQTTKSKKLSGSKSKQSSYVPYNTL